MCIEDYRIGNKVYPKPTPVAAGTSVDFGADARRVGIRMVTRVSSSSGTFVTAFPLSPTLGVGFPLLVNNDFQPVDEIWLTQHGNIVKGPFTVSSTFGNVMVWEYLLDDQENSPKKVMAGSINNGL